MSLVSEPLPTDLDALRLFAENLQAELARKDGEIAANAAEIYAKTLHIEKLKMQLAKLQRARFGRSSEKLDHDIDQLELLIGELEEDSGEREARDRAADPGRHRPERKHPVRKPLPAHLPREVITHDPAHVCPGCGGTTFSRIGQDDRDVLEYIPSLQGDPAPSAQAELPVLRDDRPGPNAAAADRARAPGARADHSRRGVEIL
jgi:hypothetical protein